MNKNTTKQWLCFMGLAMLAGGDAMAQRLSLSPIQIEAGGTADLVVSIDAQGQNVYGIQTQIKLPAGLTFAGKPKAVAGCMVDEDGVDANATVQLNASNGKLGVISLEGYTFKSQTPVATITVEAAADFVNAKGQLVAVTTTGTSFTTSAAGEEAAAAAEAVPATVEAEYNAYEAGDVISFTGASIGTGIRTYAKDVKTGEVSGMQAVSTWHLIEGDARAAGVFPAASTAFLGSEDYVAPASTTELLGIVAVWTATTQYTTNIVLPAGEYWLPINVYNVGGWGTFQKNLIGFVADDGTEYLAQRTYYPVGVAPTQELIHFSSDSEIRGQLTLGYEAVNQGSGNMPHLFIEPIQILSEDPTPAPAPDPVPEFTDGGDYYLRNLGSGLYLGAANNWGTQASLTVHPEHVTLHKLSDGVYTIESRVSNGDEMKYFTGTYMDGAATPITFAFPDNYSTAYCTMTNGDATYGSDGGAIVSAAAEGDNALWEVIPAADMLTRMSWYANEDRPMDATFLIGDAGFGRNNVDVAKWTVSDDCVNKNLAGGNYNNFANSCAESFHSPFTISQVLAGAPNGVYRLTAQAFYRQDGSDNDHLPVVFANDATATFPLLTTEENSMDMAAETFAAGGYPVDPIYFQVTDGQLTVGVRLEGNNMLWCIWDNFELQYYGNSTTPESAELADIYNTQIQPLLAEAQQILGSTELDEVKQLLGWAKDYDDLLLERSKDAYNKFIADATEQIAAARQIIENAEPGPEPGPSEITLEEAYANALATVANSTYRIFTTAADGAKLYLNAQGYLVGQEEAAAFNIASVTAEGTLYETGWNLGCRFTNPGLTNGSTGTIVNTGHINVGGNNRNDWERQVFFLNNDGMYAVRATNANSANWGANSYWNVFDGAELPEAGYSLEPAYVWQLEDVAAEMAKNNLVADIDKLLAFIADNADAYTIDAAALEEDIAALNALKEADYETADAVAAAQDAVAAAVLDFFGEITPKANIDVTDLFIENATAVASRALPSGWEGDTFGDSSDGVSEYWNMAAASFAQTVLLPAGNYMLTAEALTRTDMTATLAAGEASMAIATVGSDVVNSRAQAAAWFDEGNGKNQLPFAVAEAAPVAISLTADAETSDYWMVWRSFKLELMADGQQPEPVAGDITGTGEVDEDDVDLFIEQLLGGQLPTDATSDDFARYDVNGDGVVNIADAQAILNLSVGLNWDGSEPDEETAEVRALTPEALSATLTAQSMTMADSITRYVVRLSGNVRYTGFQMEVVGDVVAERGALPTGPSGAALELRSRTTGGTHRIAALGDEMAAGEVLTIDVKGQARFTDICFTTAQAQALYLNIDGATAIDGIAAAGIQGAKVYGIGGEQHSATQRGINIVRQADGNVKKVIVK